MFDTECLTTVTITRKKCFIMVHFDCKNVTLRVLPKKGGYADWNNGYYRQLSYKKFVKLIGKNCELHVNLENYPNVPKYRKNR